MALSNAEAADGVAVKADGGDLLGAAPPQIGPEAPLDDAEQALIGAVVGPLAALLPASGAIDALDRHGLVGAIGEALVEDHRDVRPELLLDLHGALGGEEGAAAVHLIGKGDAFLVDLGLLQGEDLEAAGVGEDGELDPHHLVQPTVAGHDLRSWALREVVRVGEDDLGAGLGEVERGEGSDRALGAHGHEDRSLHNTPRHLQGARPSASGCGLCVKRNWVHSRLLSCSKSTLWLPVVACWLRAV